MHISHDALVKKVAVSESNPGYAPPTDGSAMNFEQKRRLSIAIGQLPGDRISEVLRIISEDDSMRVRVGPNSTPAERGCGLRIYKSIPGTTRRLYWAAH